MCLWTGIIRSYHAVSRDSPAESAGIKSGDKILSINGTAVSVTDEVSPLVNASGDSELTLVVERDGSEVTIKITPNKVHQAYYNIGMVMSAAREKVGSSCRYDFIFI